MLTSVVSRAPSGLHLHGTDFELVCVRRSGVAVYRGDTRYLRIGAELQPELAVQRLMLERGYPVPRILHVGGHDGVPYLIEESLGAHTLGDRFEAEQRVDGRISDEGFALFLAVTERYARAQAASARRASRPGDVPVAVVHPDLHAFNMCPGGVIDVEGAGVGPVGYDVATAPFVPALCGLTSARTPWFTATRISEYLAMVDGVFAEHGLSPPTGRLEELLMRRAISLCAKQHRDLAVQAARLRVLQAMVDTFLCGGGVRALLQRGR
jgi:Phosphotransferase enzyme family